MSEEARHPLEPHSSTAPPIEVFCSYAHADEAAVQTVLVALEPLVQQGLLTIWHDRRIFAGREWINEIDLHLNTAHFILLFASPAFVASRYCMKVEVPRALERAQRREAHLVPILLAPLDVSTAPFGYLQALPPSGKPLSEWTDQAEARAAIVTHLEILANRLLSVADVPTPRAHLLNLPFRRNPYFTGREDVLEQLHRSLEQHHTSALVQAIAGLGGVGKTQTAVEYVYRYQGEYDTVLWVNAESQELLIAGYGQLAHLLELPERDEKEQERITQAVICWMQTHHHWLLVLDNVDDNDIVEDFLPQTDQSHVLITTRSQMGGERVALVSVDTMDRDTGALFLLRRAKLLAVHLPFYTPLLASHLREEALQLSEELGGLPLALDQAGAYIEATSCGIAGYLERYTRNRVQYLAMRGASATEYPLSVALTWSLSLERIERSHPVAADLLRLCAFLAPDAIPERILVQRAATLIPSFSHFKNDPFLLDDALRVLRVYSLMYREVSQETEHFLSVHRLVQVVMRDEMSEEEQKQWAERAILAVNAAFPSVEFETWVKCELLLPHALMCARWIGKEHLAIEEAARLLNAVAYYLNERARYAEIEPLYTQAITIWEQVYGLDHERVATGLNNLAGLYVTQGRLLEAEPLYVRALTIKEKQLGEMHPSLAKSLNNLAFLYQDQGRLREAEPLYVRVLEIDKKVHGKEHPEVATDLNNLASLYYEQGRHSEAEPLYSRSLAIREKHLGEAHPLVAPVLNNLATLYYAQGRYEEAEPLYQRVLKIVEEQLGPEHPQTASTLNNLAELYRAQGRLLEAEPLYARVLVIDEAVYGKEHPEVATDLNNLAELYRAQGRLLEAEPLYARALTIREKQLGLEHHYVAGSLNNLAGLYETQGRLLEAEPLRARAVSIMEHVLGDRHPNTRLVRMNYAGLLRKLGRVEDAEALEGRNKESKE